MEVNQLRLNIRDERRKKKIMGKNKDFFNVLVNKGSLRISGLNKRLNPYRVFKYNNKYFKLTLNEVKRKKYY